MNNVSTESIPWLRCERAFFANLAHLARADADTKRGFVRSSEMPSERSIGVITPESSHARIPASNENPSRVKGAIQPVELVRTFANQRGKLRFRAICRGDESGGTCAEKNTPPVLFMLVSP
jgi:hypothetical protein